MVYQIAGCEPVAISKKIVYPTTIDARGPAAISKNYIWSNQLIHLNKNMLTDKLSIRHVNRIQGAYVNLAMRSKYCGKAWITNYKNNITTIILIYLMPFWTVCSAYLVDDQPLRPQIFKQ